MKKKQAFLLPLVAMSLILAGCNGNNGNQKDNTGSSQSSGATSSSSSMDGDISYEVENPTGVLAEGMMDFSQLNWKERSKILSQLEYYALRNHTAGIPLYDDASYEQFSNRIKLPSTTYQTNYGFGTSYGSIDASKTMYNGEIDEPVAKWKSYFHGYTNTDSGTFNGWNSTGSDVSSRMAMITSIYFGVMANKENTSYSWLGSLSKDDAPIMLSEEGEVITPDADGYITQTDAKGNPVKVAYEEATSRKWRVRVKTGSELIYHTADVSKWKSKYNGTCVKLSDYLTPFKAMIMSNMARTSELISDTSGFEGAMDLYYNNKRTQYLSDEEWAKSGIGIQLNEKENAIEFTFIQPKSVSYARTSLSSSLYSPLPQEFLEDIGNGSFTTGSTNFGTIGKTSSGNYDDVFDNILILGPYIPEYWQQNSKIAYRANKDYYEASDYHYDGYTEVVFAGSSADEQAYTAFTKNQLDEVTIPVSQLKNHKNDPNVLRTEGSTVIKLNLNCTTEKEWEGYFGESGTISTHKKKNYWNTQAIMSNDYFLDGLYFAIDRKELADAAGRNPSVSYLSGAYMLDPSGQVSYRDSDYGKAAVIKFQKTAGNEYCYSKAVAENYFKKAGEQLLENGDYSKGDTIVLQAIYRYQSTIDNLGSYIKKYVEDAFNEANKDNDLTLELNLQVGGNQYTDTYTKMDNGEFDLAEGAISGNVLNPLEFMNTLSTNKALNNGFCLNWGHPTNALHEEGSKDRYAATYNGYDYSYDALWNASQGITPVSEGKSVAIGENAALSYNGDDDEHEAIHFSCEYPAIATDDKGKSLYEFKIDKNDIAVISSSQEGGWDSGYYISSSAVEDLNVNDNGYVEFWIAPSAVEGACKMAASSSGKTQRFFRLYFTLRYSIKLDSGTIQKSVLMDVSGKLSDFLIDDQTAPA